MKTTTLFGSLVMAATVLTSGPDGQAQPPPVRPPIALPRLNQYAVKILCGKSGDGAVVAPGQYFTAVNVHNPGRTGVGFRKKVALANPGQKPGKVSKFIDGKLGADEAMEVECRELAAIADVAPGSLFSGYLVFETKEDSELDIVAVYTAAGNAGVSALHTERVPRRLVP